MRQGREMRETAGGGTINRNEVLRMKKMLALLLAMSLLLAGCGDAPEQSVTGTLKNDSVETVAPVTGTIAAEETALPEAEDPVSMGRMDGGTYINEYTGYACDLDSSWTFYSAEELQELPGNVQEILEGTEIGDSMEGMEQFTDMMAENADIMVTMNVLYQKQTMQERIAMAMLDDSEILEATLQQKDQLVAAYAQAGIEVGTLEPVTVTFLGQERSALHMSSVMQGVPYYTLQIFDYDLGRYRVTLTLASFVEDNTWSLLELFYPVA